jgi:hypothetical protein
MTEASAAAGQGFSQAFGESQAASAGTIAGPITSTVQDALAKARAAATATNEAAATGVKTPTVAPAFSGPSTEALKATDSRSKEGVAEMFRLMRGGDNVQQQIAENTRRIADNTGEPEDVSEMEMVGA